MEKFRMLPKLFDSYRKQIENVNRAIILNKSFYSYKKLKIVK